MDTSKSFATNYANAVAMLLILSITAIVDFARDNNVVGAGIGGGYDESGGTVNISGDESHRANCEWCKTGEWAAHRFDSSGHVCPECGYSRVLISFDANGGDHSAADYALLTPETEELTGWVAATTGMTNQNRLTVSGEANLILFDGATVTVPKGIAVNEGASLTIWQQSDGSGTLIAAAEADSYNAAIGGDSGKSSGLITINGGVVDATGSKYGAGIGGGNQHIGTVVINGGSVTAQGGYHAAGIGGGTQGLATVTVNGGVVNATGGDSGAGIGAGYNNAYLPNKALNVTINGGIITATGGSGASAIGCGDRTDYGSCSVSINGGQITANGGVSSKCTDSRQGSIILNWTDDSKASMSLTSDSYSGAVTLSKTFRDENGNIYGATDSADNSALAGRTLTPCEGIFAGYSLSLGGDIGVNFYLDLPDEALAQGVRIDFAWNGKTDSVTFDSNSTAETREGVAGLYKATCNVCAAEMNDAVTACVTVGESAGPVETVSRKVRDYADYILANKDGKYSDKLIMLVKSMLNYGANAQTQFEHNTDALANAGVGYPLSSLNDNEINGIAGAVPEKDSIRALLADKGIAYHGYSLILNTKTTLRFYFKKDGADYTQLALLNSAGANVGTVQDQDTDDCYIEVGDISAFELGDCYELKFGDTTLGSFSALSYVKDVLQNNNGAQPITDTVTALYRYHEAAAAYFNHNA